jgi:murein DD-endopeptidase MepM/ murein hydrolase activator NlpD
VVRSTLLLVCFGAVGCATPPPVVVAVPEAPVAHAAPAVRAPKRVSSGKRIDEALLQFRSARSSTRSVAPSSGTWTQLWWKTLDSLDDALQTPPVASDLGAFVRARITLEVEWETDLQKGRMLSDGVKQRLQQTLLGVDEGVSELRAANAPGTGLAMQHKLVDGDIILRAPVSPMIVSSPFGNRVDPITSQRRFHAGVDFDAPLGSTVFAAATGIVVYAGLQGGYGNYVVLDHGEGVRTHYAHLQKIEATLGAMVEEGETLGFVGSTGRSTGPHLHYAVTNLEGEFLEPLELLDVPLSTVLRARQGIMVEPEENLR